MSTRTGVLLVNLGSPSEPTPEAVRKYLAQFLHDHRVIDTSRWIWCPILHGIILRVRPKKSAAKYAQVWDEPVGFPGTDAPLVRITRAQGTALKGVVGPDYWVEIGMRYGEPSVETGLKNLVDKGCHKICVLPLYPQFSHTTTSAVKDAVDQACEKNPTWPVPSFLPDYHTEPAYIAAISQSLKDHIESLSWEPDVVLTSYHGLPQRYVDQGDPYADQCKATTDLLKAHMVETSYDIRLTFQSRFGRLEWLQPYTDKTLTALAEQGIKNIVIITPGFSADCLETLEELAIEAKEIFIEAGGENFSLVPCLNADQDHITTLAGLVKTMNSASA